MERPYDSYGIQDASKGREAGSRQSKSQIRTIFGNQNDMSRDAQSSRARSRGPQNVNDNNGYGFSSQIAKGFGNFGGAFMKLFGAGNEG